MGWTSDGDLVLNSLVGRKTVSISALPDSDLFLPDLGHDVAYLRFEGDLASLHYQFRSGDRKTALLDMGRPLLLGPITWVLTRSPAKLPPSTPLPTGDVEDPSDGVSHLLTKLMSWVRRPMGNQRLLKDGLAEFLRLLVQNTPAINGMIALCDRGGFNLVSTTGLLPSEAQRLWAKMPASLTSEILRTKARILLPAEFKRSLPADSTIFVRGVKSVAGFPVLAEEQIVGVFYLNFDNFLKSFSEELQSGLEAAADLLGLVIQRGLLREQMNDLRHSRLTAGPERSTDRLMIGASQDLDELYDLIRRLAPVDVSVLVQGETGTGKELAARELHRFSHRRRRPFIAINAAALPESLIESELFGHKKGAFTGAISDRKGLIEQAHEGTLFIDEIGELPLSLQAKLLRVLQEQTLRRIGEAESRRVDFRLIAATHRDLTAMVAAETFREDLFYRIAGATIQIAPLRERRSDILPLANYFKRRFASRHGLDDKQWSFEAQAALSSHDWPGNVRELENVVTRAFVMTDASVITCPDLGLQSPQGGDSRNSATTEIDQPFSEARDTWTRNFLRQALLRHQGRRSDTAKALGIGERTLFRYLEQFDIRDV